MHTKGIAGDGGLKKTDVSGTVASEAAGATEGTGITDTGGEPSGISRRTLIKAGVAVAAAVAASRTFNPLTIVRAQPHRWRMQDAWDAGTTGHRLVQQFYLIW